MIKKPIHIEQAGMTKKNTPYFKVVWDDEKSDTIFDEAMVKDIGQAIEGGCSVEVKKVKNGNYWNVTEITVLQKELETEKPALVQEAEKLGAKLEKVTTIGEGKNRSFALSYAKDIVIATLNKDLLKEKITEKTIEFAKKFEKYLETGE